MSNILPQLVFYFFAGLAIFAAFMVVTQNNPVRCVLFLVLTFFASSVLWILVQAEFLALILVLVYVGAVMTLFLFVVMMLNIDVASMRSHFLRYLPFGLMIVALLTALIIIAIPSNSFMEKVKSTNQPEWMLNGDLQFEDSTVALPVSNTEKLGLVLYTDYVLAFELAAVILLVAIIAAITLVHRAPIRSKKQMILQQLLTRPEDRVRLVRVKSEPE